MFRYLATALALLACGPALGQSRDAAPPVPFDAETPPPAPDYDLPGNWAARPERPGVSGEVPPDVTKPTALPAADVFYIHPTTYRSARWNQAVEDDQVNAWTDVSVVARQASIFNGCCRVFAPRYRQASGRAFADMAGDGMKAYRLAFEDVKRAFDHYIADDNHGRPFIIVGHSQGALQTMFLLQERIDGKPLQKQLVAAYVIGIGVSLGEFGTTLPYLHACARSTDTGCVISWNSFMAGSDVSAWAQRSASRYIEAYGNGPGAALLCTNPLTFDLTKPDVPASANLGALTGRALAGPLPSLALGATGARCAGGVVLASPLPGLGVTPLPGGSLHMDDMGLFYGNIRANAAIRVRAFLQDKSAR